MRPCVCHFFCVILQRKIKVLQYLAHAEGDMSFGWADTGHIEKGVLRALFWLFRIW